MPTLPTTPEREIRLKVEEFTYCKEATDEAMQFISDLLANQATEWSLKVELEGVNGVMEGIYTAETETDAAIEKRKIELLTLKKSLRNQLASLRSKWERK